MTGFDSLALALEDWFDKPLSDLPDGLRERFENQLLFLLWDSLSVKQRRNEALQLDYEADPATEKDRQFWWDFFSEKEALEEKIAKWESIAAPTATDLAMKEAKLKEFRDELNRMKQLVSANHFASCLFQKNTTKRKAQPNFIDAMNRLLDEIERRSSARGKTFNRNSLPGTKANLQAVASKYDISLDDFSPQTFDDYLNGICQFKKGRPPTDAKNPYAELFPEFF